MSGVSVFYKSNDIGRTGVVRLPGKIKPCFVIKLGDFFDNTKKMKRGDSVVITNFSLKKQEIASPTSTLGSNIFLYVGGETPWEITLQGIAFLSCNRKMGKSHGFSDIVQWYREKNVKASGKPMNLTFQDKVYKGYLTFFQIQSEYKYINAFSFTAGFIGVLKD